MTYSRSTPWLVFACLAASLGCGRRAVVAPPGDSASAAEPAAHMANAEDKNPGDGPPFRFADDAAGKLLAKVLPPTEVKGPLDAGGAGPRRLPPSAGLDAVPLTLPPTEALPPHLDAGQRRITVAPHLAVDETAGLGLGDPDAPQARAFVVGGRTRLASIDSNRPPPLPLLGQQSNDRAPLDDPTLEASAEAATSAAMPQRAKAVPYFRVTTPDPYDNRQPLTLPVPPDDFGPSVITIHPPQR